MQMKDPPSQPFPAHQRNIVITDSNMAPKEMGTALWVILDIYCICAGSLVTMDTAGGRRRILTRVKSVRERGGRYFIL
jgi:hypothetical protein